MDTRMTKNHKIGSFLRTVGSARMDEQPTRGDVLAVVKAVALLVGVLLVVASLVD